MAKTKTRPFDPAAYLTTPQSVEVYLNDAFATGDVSFIADALGVVARARGMTEISKRTGLGRESLYKALSPTGRPELATVLKLVSALGLTLTVRAP